LTVLLHAGSAPYLRMIRIFGKHSYSRIERQAPPPPSAMLIA
jgi:hypothetical protein